jgi:hypothetical protein
LLVELLKTLSTVIIELDQLASLLLSPPRDGSRAITFIKNDNKLGNS